VYSLHPDPPSIVAGCIQHGRLTTEEFHDWLLSLQLLRTDVPWRLYPIGADSKVLDNAGLDPRSASLLPPGDYAVLSDDAQPIAVELTHERHRPRTLSLDISKTGRTDAFRERIRERDMRCCVTQQLVPGLNPQFSRFRASHIFPVAHKDVWDLLGLAQFIEDDAPNKDIGPASINSIQNGFLLRSDIHDGFDNYEFGINPDKNYQIYDFTDAGEFDGRRLWINETVDPKYRPSAVVLREHFRQCVLANIKGAGQQSEDWFDPEDEQDLSIFSNWGVPDGHGGPSRLELELRARLLSSQC